MRQAGESLNLTPELVAYMAISDRTGVEDPGMNQVLADRLTPVFEGSAGQAVNGQGQPAAGYQEG